MTGTSGGRELAGSREDEMSLFTLGSVLLRWRWAITVLGLGGATLGLAAGLTAPRVYVSSATLLPETSAAEPASALATAVSQFGIAMPRSGTVWGPSLYVELLQSDLILEPIVLDTVVLAEEDGRRLALLDLLNIKAPTLALSSHHGVQVLRSRVKVIPDKNLGGVRLSVTTRWPSVSLVIAQKLLEGVNRFTLETRRSQAAAEREFVEGQTADAEHALRVAEDRLQTFLERNRAISGSPELELARGRLEREMAMRQAVYSTLMQNLAVEKLREMRNTPMITVLEAPQLPVVGEARKTVLRTVVGGLAGGMLGVLVAFIMYGGAAVRRASGEDAQEFFELVEQGTPPFLRGKGHPRREEGRGG